MVLMLVLTLMLVLIVMATSDNLTVARSVDSIKRWCELTVNRTSAGRLRRRLRLPLPRLIRLLLGLLLRRRLRRLLLLRRSPVRSTSPSLWRMLVGVRASGRDALEALKTAATHPWILRITSQSPLVR